MRSLRERLYPLFAPPDAAPQVLYGARVTLRPYAVGFSEAELQLLYAWGCDPDLAQLAGGSTLDVTFARFRELFGQQLAGHNSADEQLFGVLDQHGRLIGRAGLFALTSLGRSAELGVVIGDRACWGRGYGRDVAQTLVRFGFDVLGVRRIYLYTFRDNVRAQRAFAAAGFRPVRRLDRFSLQQGTHGEVEMEIRLGRELQK